MKKIENYINYIFTGYPDNLKVQELKDELTTNLIDRANDYIKLSKSPILNDNYKYELKQKQQDDSITGIIFIIGVIIFLIVGFSLNAWHPGWIIFPICALIVMIYESTNKFKH